MVNNVFNRIDALFAVVDLVDNTLRGWDSGSDKLLQNGVVRVGYTDDNLTLLNQEGFDYLVTVQEDYTNTTGYSNPGRDHSSYLDNSFTVPYQFTIRTREGGHDDFASNDQENRLNHIFDNLDFRLVRDDSNSPYTVTPSLINYRGQAQTSLSGNDISIYTESSSVQDPRLIDKEAINTSQYVTGAQVYLMSFRQDNYE